ncbi:MAG: hypothetical protein QOF59_1311, partial [Actinomycetota bacterium]|nr:hypothetical protein [Actinomycetota bacterium]
MTKPEDPREDSPDDSNIRDLVRELVASAPVAPPLPDASVIPSLRRNRTRVAGAVALASLVAIVAGVLWVANRGDDKHQIVIEQPSPSTTSRPTPTTLRSAADVFPSGTALIGLDRNTGAVDALDGNGRALRRLFNARVETTHHWPTITQLQLAPDRRTLWYAENPTALAPCSAITERDLVAGATHVRFQGSWIALSPDGTRLAYTGCFGRDSTVHIVDLGSNRVWTAGSPGGGAQAAVGYVAWTPDSRSVLVEYLDDKASWHVSTLTPTSRPGAIEWGPTVLLLGQQDRLTATPAALYVAAGNAAGNAWSIDAYDWSFRRISHVPTQLGPLEIVVRDGRTYVIGGPFTGGSGYDTGLYRLESNGQLVEIRHGLGGIVAVPRTASIPATGTTTTTST